MSEMKFWSIFLVAVIVVTVAKQAVSVPYPVSTGSNEICALNIDLVVLIDSSESVSKEEWELVIDNVEQLQSYFTVAEDVRFAILDFSHVSNVYKHLDANNTHAEIVDILEILRSRKQNGRSAIERGIGWALKVFELDAPKENNVKKLLVYTDGEFTDVQNTFLKEYVYLLENKNITMDFVMTKNKSFADDADSVFSYLLRHRLVKLFQLNNNVLNTDAFSSYANFNGHNARIEVSSEKEAALFSHNIVRKLHGVPLVKWNAKLEKQAQDWARHLATTNTIENSSMDGYGENIYYYRGRQMHIYDAVQTWYSTIAYYNFNKPGWLYKAGTFTQLMWDDSIVIGTGIAYNPVTRVTFIVANYVARGNSYHGEPFAEHVNQPLKGLPAYIPDVKELITPSNDNGGQLTNDDAPLTAENLNMVTLAKDLCNRDIEGWSGTPNK